MLDIEKFVKNVKFYCNRKEVKPTVACRESGAGERFFENAKRGSVPSVEKVQMLAQYLGVTTSELLGETAVFRDGCVNSPHATRHTYASRAAAAGMRPEILQKILGHVDYSTTANIYVHADAAELVAAVEKCL